MQLDPVRSYPERAAGVVAKLTGASAFRLELAEQGGEVEGGINPDGAEPVSLPLRNGRQPLGTLHLYFAEPRKQDSELRTARWAARMLARGMAYAERLAAEGGRRGGENLEETLARAPLTPRERDVVSLLVGGCSTRDIASRTGLTVATVNTYLKRIFSKLGVHSRVELVARMAGTAAPGDGASADPNAANAPDTTTSPALA